MCYGVLGLGWLEDKPAVVVIVVVCFTDFVAFTVAIMTAFQHKLYVQHRYNNKRY